MDSVANKITVARIILAPLYVIIFLLPIPYRELWAALLFVIAASSDGLDGYLARKSKTVTTFGKFLDPLADKLLISAALITLTWLQQVGPLAVFTIICREFAVTGLRVIAASQGTVISASKLGKAKTLSQIIAITALTLNLGLDSGNTWVHKVLGFLPVELIAKIAIIVAVIMTVVSGLDYFIKNKYVFKKGLA
jgi:CDP-diacylglycerol--glycerol-3-phosphate 3-phosphatidyltransferase